MTTTLPQIPTIPWTSAEEIARSAFGAFDAVGWNCRPLENVNGRTCYDKRGICFATGNDGRIRACVASHSYTGIKLGSSDSRVTDCDLFNHRDVCLWIAANAGNCQADITHCYGARIACYNEGGGPFRATGCTFADALIGYLGDINGGGSNQTTLTNVLFQHCSVAACVFRASGGRLIGCTVNVQRATNEHNQFSLPGLPLYQGAFGVALGYRCSILGGCVELTPWIHDANTPSGRAAQGIWVAGDNCRIETDLIEWDGIDGAIGIALIEKRSNIVIDCNVEGFDGPRDRILFANTPCSAIDATFRVRMVKPIEQYIDIAPGWTGSVRLIDTATGKVFQLPEGSAV